VIVSADAIELQGLCDRVLVFSRGQIVRTLEGAEITEENITGAAITSTIGQRATMRGRIERMRQLRHFAAGDYLPSVVLGALILGLAAYTASANGFYLSKINMLSLLLLVSALALTSLGQLVVLLTGGIDLSVGPLMGLTVVVLSFFAATGQGGGELALGILLLVGVAVAVGLANGVLVRLIRLSPVVATLATYIVIQGISLVLRPQPAGYIRSGVTSAITTSIGPIPVAFIVVVAITIACELLLRFSGRGLEIRAVGSDETRAHRLGAHVNATHLMAYVVCSLFAAAGGVMLASQVAVGDPSLGVNYTLTSITAVVLGGTSIFGGRGSFVGAMLGALLIQEIVNATTFLHIGLEWNSWLPGILILAGAGVYSRARGIRATAVDVDV
jgi:ribose transport system ATP-binding protein